MAIGIGGAGSKLALGLDPSATIVNVSETELNKQDCPNKILAVVHNTRGQLRGSRKDPQLGRDAFLSIKRELMHLVRGNVVFSSTGGGTGNGITASILEELSLQEDVGISDRTLFALVLPCSRLESTDYINNTVRFLRGALSDAIDTGNTGNIFLFSNTLKFDSRLTEETFNRMCLDSLTVFQSIPAKGESMRLIEGHIDYEDFALYQSRPFFNHFTYFDYDPAGDFGDQLRGNANPLLLAPENPIEALFLLEVPAGWDPSFFYDVLDHFSRQNVTPVFSVVENDQLERAFITVSLLYSRKPAELVADFNRIAEEHSRVKVAKSLEQHVPLPLLQVNLEDQAKRVAQQRGTEEADILGVLKRIGKL